jgi:hypothetical protein
MFGRAQTDLTGLAVITGGAFLAGFVSGRHFERALLAESQRALSPTASLYGLPGATPSTDVPSPLGVGDLAALLQAANVRVNVVEK